MWRNYFSVAFRNLGNNKVFTLINISGLAIGLASSVLIILFIAREISFDRFHQNSHRIYRLYIDGEIGEQDFRGAWTSMVMAPTFTEKIPEIENYVRFDVFNQVLVWYEGQKRIEDHCLFADSSIASIFSLNFIYGDPDSALVRPRSIVITREKAREYFGEENPVGLPLSINRDSNYYWVSGVIEPLPDNSHFFADFIVSMSSLGERSNNTWFQNSIFSYVLLSEDAEYKKVEKRMEEVMNEEIRPELESMLGVNPEEWQAGGNSYGVYLQPLNRIHLEPDIEVGVEICFRPVNNRLYIYIFSLIAFFILFIATINFMNLSTARSVTRGREIGIRKAVGSDRRQLIKQFLAESVLMSLIALVFALILVELLLPLFNRIMELNLRMEAARNIWVLLILIGLSILVGLLSGLYPAIFLSRFRPVQGIRGDFPGGKRAGYFRSILVVAQFTISVAIITSTFIISMQLRYMLNKDLGYENQHLVVLKRIYPLGGDIQSFCREVEKIPGVVSASNSSTYLGFDNATESYQIEGKEISQNYLFSTNYVDYSFFKTYGFGLKGKDSRFFTEEFPSDTDAILLNEAAITEYEITDPLNTVILESSLEGDTSRLRIIGITSDFHHSTLHDPVGPYMLRFKREDHGWAGFITIRLGVAGKGVPSTLNKIRKSWLKMTNEAPFQYFFLDEELDNYYKEERRTGRLSLLFSILGAFIALMGLFGLTLHNTKRRMREIGIRKAMGASIGAIVYHISRDIVLLMSVSVILAWIGTFVFMQIWLKSFPFNIGFRPWIYLSAAQIAMLVSMLTVSILAYRAARANPASVLHYE